MSTTHQADVDKVVRKAFDKWAQTKGAPYRDLVVTVESNDGYFATVRVIAWLRPSPISPWYENHARADCKQVGSKWQCQKAFDFRWADAEVARRRLRFMDDGDGTVTDTDTKLVWLKNANYCEADTWDEAVALVSRLASGSQGLYDGSTAGQWRLPTLDEWQSLISVSQIQPALPCGHPFTDVQLSYYWSATSDASNPANILGVHLHNGSVISGYKAAMGYVWPVRDGQC